ncbi:MAG: hypothetical protein C4318_01100 [Acidimicrobiia bacterium]
MASKRELSGRYVLRRLLASGGQASVWEARDIRLGRQVAVKLLSPEMAARPGVVERFRREALAAASLLHPNIAQVYDSGREDGSYFIVMELLEGGSLAQLLAIRPLDQTEAAVVGTAVARALAYAHSKGILHRDVKPSNVIFTHTGFPKLADFGIARSLDTLSSELTSDGAVVGTLSYMAPEQILGGSISEATDIYSLGLVLYEALSGRNPRKEASLARAAARASMSLPSLAQIVDGLDPEIVGLVDSCLAVDPASRPQRADAVAEVLSGFTFGKTELDLTLFSGPEDEAATVTANTQGLAVANPKVVSGRGDTASLLIAPPNEVDLPERASALSEEVHVPSLSRALRVATVRGSLRFAAAVFVAAVFGWIGWNTAGALSFRLAHLISKVFTFAGQ